MTQEGAVLQERMLNLIKGFTTKPERATQIRLLKGVLTTGTDLLAELRAEEIVDSLNRKTADV